MTVLQIILAICAFAVAFWLINRYLVGVVRNICLIVVVILALFVLLNAFGLVNLLNTRVTGGQINGVR